MSSDRPSEQSDALEAGTVLRDYTIERVIGQGGFGLTYLARDEVFERQVAIKEFLPADIARRFGDSRVGPRATQYRESFEWGLSEFLGEAQLLDRLDHPNVVRVRSFFRENDTAYLVMEYVQGPTLEARLQADGPLSAADLAALLTPLVGGLEHVHASGCLHRDIKPENIILRGGQLGSPVLIDFGAARKAIAERTRSMAAVVSAGYTPLEQYSSHRVLTPATDLYALCAVAYRCITGEDPPPATDRAISESMPRLAGHAAGSYPRALLEAIDAGLALRVADRPGDLSGLRAALGEAAALGADSPGAAGTRTTVPSSSSPGRAAPRRAERERNRRTVKVSFTEEVAPASETSPAEPGTAGSGARGPGVSETDRSAVTAPAVFPPPVYVCLAALLVGTAGGLRVGRLPWEVGLMAYSLLQGAFAFPLAAYLGAYLVQRWLARPDAGVLRRVGVCVASYVAISILSVWLYKLSQEVTEVGMYQALAGPWAYVEGLPSAYVLMASSVPVEFATFAVLLGLLHLPVLRRLRWMRDVLRPLAPVQRWLSERGVIVPVVLTLGFAGLVTERFLSARHSHIEQGMELHLQRTGYLLASGDEAVAAAKRAIEEYLGLAAGDDNDRRIYEWLRGRPTRRAYTVASDGSGDFNSIGRALEHVARVSESVFLKQHDYPGRAPVIGDLDLTLRVRPGRYRESLYIHFPVELVGDGRPDAVVIEAPGSGSAVRVKDLSANDSVLIRGLTLQGTGGNESVLDVEERGTVRLVQTRILGGAGTRCGMRVLSAPPQAGSTSGGQAGGRIEVTESTFTGRCGLQVEGSARPLVSRSSFIGTTRFGIRANDESAPEVRDSTFSDVSTGWIVVVNEASATVKGGTFSGKASDGTGFLVLRNGRLRIQDARLSAPTECIYALDQGSVVVERTTFDCGGRAGGSDAVRVEGEAQVAIRNCTFAWRADAGYTSRNYVLSRSGTRVTLENNSVVR